MQTLFGTGVAVVTPFTSAGEIDFPALGRIIEHLIAGKVEYLVALGTTGESATLTAEEKREVLDFFAEKTKRRIPLAIGVGGNNTAEITKQIDHVSKTWQPAAILSVSPYYNKPTQEGIYQHYKTIAQATDLPIILYNVPGRTASNLTAETTLRLAHEVANIVAIKDASGNLEQAMQVIRHAPEGFVLMSGDDPFTLPLVALGGCGVISVTANAHPYAFSQMVRHALNAEMEAARKLHYELLPAINLNFVEGNPAGVKQMMALMGLCEAHVRLPLVAASQELADRMQAVLPALAEA